MFRASVAQQARADDERRGRKGDGETDQEGQNGTDPRTPTLQRALRCRRGSVIGESHDVGCAISERPACESDTSAAGQPVWAG